MIKEKVELFPAHRWDCPECGRQNYCDSWPVELSEEEMKEMRDEYDIPNDESILGNFRTCPEEVECKFCKETFETEDFRW